MQSTVSTPRFASLPPIGTLPPSLKCGTIVKTLKLPKVVNQILSDCEEHWYHLARSLEERVVQSDLRSVMVISSLQGEGCTTISLCLATAVAKVCRRRILLLDADFSNPGIRQALSLKPKAGLEQVIVEGYPLDKAIVKAELPELCVLPMMQGFQYPATVHKNRAVEALLESLRTHFDLIVIDGGSAFSGRNPTQFASGVDAALIVRDPNKSGDRLLEQLDLYLTEQEICGLGVIENCVE